MSIDKSRAGSGEGISDPDEVKSFSEMEHGKVTDVGVVWDGDEYDPRFTWILASVDSLVELADNNG